MDQEKTYVDGLVYAYKLLEGFTKVGIYNAPITGVMNDIITEIRSQSKLDLLDIDIDDITKSVWEIWHRPKD
mgnify:FL=1